jgi:hypothetical protein
MLSGDSALRDNAVDSGSLHPAGAMTRGRTTRKDWGGIFVRLLKHDEREFAALAKLLDVRDGPLARELLLASVRDLALLRLHLGDAHFRAFVAEHGVADALDQFRKSPAGRAYARRKDDDPTSGTLTDPVARPVPA